MLPRSLGVVLVLSFLPTATRSQEDPIPRMALPAVSETSPLTSGGGPRDGCFSLLTYNVAGIPEPFNFGRPDLAQALISPLLNGYDLVLVQEDFAFHGALSAAAEHLFQSVPMRDEPLMFALGDGLSTFSELAVAGFERQTWEICSGLFARQFDCIADKGFALTVVALPGGAALHVYNVHFDAGTSEADHEARDIQTDQLIEAIRARSEGYAVILAGDTNMRPSRRHEDARNIERIQAELGLTDACTALDCYYERIDRVFYRSGRGLSLEAQSYEVPRQFVGESGQPLSDHRPVAVQFLWTLQ